MSKQLNSHQFEQIYNDLKIDLDDLGCVMLDLEPIKNIYVNEEDLYKTSNEKRFWIDGWVADNAPHVTLLYGLLANGHDWSEYIEKVLKTWDFDGVTIENIGFFDSPYPDEDYYCIVAHLKTSEELLEGHRRLEFLPHINTFTGYKPHMTLCYIKKDKDLRDKLIKKLNSKFRHKEIMIKGLNLGTKKENN